MDNQLIDSENCMLNNESTTALTVEQSAAFAKAKAALIKALNLCDGSVSEPLLELSIRSFLGKG